MVLLKAERHAAGSMGRQPGDRPATSSLLHFIPPTSVLVTMKEAGEEGAWGVAVLTERVGFSFRL